MRCAAGARAAAGFGMTRASGGGTSTAALLFIATISVSAFLLFMVQPMVGKHILPWFGGGPGVWTLCLTFYQSTLFLGYVYAHLLIEQIARERQPFVHALVFAAALAVLPVLPGESWQPETGVDPSARILMILLVNVGLPFFLLAATGPLLQAWFARAQPSRSPYPLYAASNFGSLLALVSYPVLIEPQISLPQASRLWSWGFASCGIAILACAWLAKSGPRVVGAVADGKTESVAARDVALWILLPAVAVVLLLGITNKLCLDVASVPFLWIAPLCIYLITLIVCFASDRAYRRGAFSSLAAISTLVLVLVWLSSDKLGRWMYGSASILPQVVVYSLALFSTCMLAHGELYRLRPPPARLTAYYLCISGGGALGGLFVGLVAPRIFSNYYELPLGLGACWILFLLACRRDPDSGLHAGGPGRARRIAAVVGVGALVALIGVAAFPERGVLAGGDGNQPERRVLLQERNFFGVLTIQEVRAVNPERYQLELSSGTTMHGVQLVVPAPRLPTSYFSTHSGIGFVMRGRGAGERTKVGVIGLGVGTLAAYGRSGDHFRFYEIDPHVIRIARDDGRFSFLGDSAAEIEILPGDARLTLQSELQRGLVDDFDLLVLDAFNSDAIPMHLLTREAFRLYERRVAPNGVLALHVSAEYVDLVPLVFRMAENVGFHALAISNQEHQVSSYSDWVILSRDRDYIDSLTAFACGDPEAPVTVWVPTADRVANTPIWTDDYSNLFRSLRSIAGPDATALFRDRCAELVGRSGREQAMPPTRHR